MVTKAIIKGKDPGSNKYIVRIPFLETSASKSTVSNQNLLYEAILASTPGVIESYKENDVVIVSFEDHRSANPVIIGKLYLNNEEPRGYARLESLEVTGKTILSSDTMLGNISVKDLEKLVKAREIEEENK